ncbi:hypothetical protein YC2023_001000 [Brassica napus]
MACQAKFTIPDCLRLVIDNKVRTERCTDIADKDLFMDLYLQLGKNEKKPILIIDGDKNYFTCIEGFPKAYLMIAEYENPNHEFHVKTKVA